MCRAPGFSDSCIWLAQLPSNIPMCMHSTEQGSASSLFGRKSEDAAARAKMQQLVLVADRMLFPPTAAGMVPETPFASAHDDVASWLTRHGAAQYAPAFRAAAITPQLCESLDESGWAQLWAGDLMRTATGRPVVTEADRVRLMHALPDLVNRGISGAPAAAPVFGAPAAAPAFGAPAAAAAPAFGAPAAAPAFGAPAAAAAAPMGGAAPSSPGGYSVPTAAAAGSLAFGAAAAPSAVPAQMGQLNVRVLLTAEPPGEFSPPGSEVPPSVLGSITVPDTIGSFAEARVAVEAQLPGRLPASIVFVRHGVPVGKKQELWWACELNPASLDLIVRGKAPDSPVAQPAPAATFVAPAGPAAPAAGGFGFGQQPATAAPVAPAAGGFAFGQQPAVTPVPSAPDMAAAAVPAGGLDMFGGMEIAGDDFMAGMDAIAAAAPPPVAVQAVAEPEGEFSGGIKRGGKKKRKAKAAAATSAAAAVPAVAAAPAAAAPAAAAAFEFVQQPASTPAPAPAPVAAPPAAVEQEEEYRVDPEDGCEYTKEDFIDAYGGTAEWEAAAPVQTAPVAAPAGNSFDAHSLEPTSSVSSARGSTCDQVQQPHEASPSSGAGSIYDSIQSADFGIETSDGSVLQEVMQAPAAAALASDDSVMNLVRAAQEARVAKMAAAEAATATGGGVGEAQMGAGVPDVTGGSADAADAIRASVEAQMMRTAQMLASPEPEPAAEITGGIFGTAGQTSIYGAPAVPDTTVTADGGFDFMAPVGSPQSSTASASSIYDTPAAEKQMPATSFDFMAACAGAEPEPEPEPEPQGGNIYGSLASGGSVAESASAGSFDFMSQPAPSSEPVGDHADASALQFTTSAQSAGSTGSIYDAPAAAKSPSDANGSVSFDFMAPSEVAAAPEPAHVAAAAAFDLTFMSQPAPTSPVGVTSPPEPEPELEPAASMYESAAVPAAETSGGSFDFMQQSAPSEPAAVGALAFDFAASTAPGVQDASPHSVTSTTSAASETSGVSEASASSFDFIASNPPQSTTNGQFSESTGSIYDTPAPIESQPDANGSGSSFDFMAPSAVAAAPEPAHVAAAAAFDLDFMPQPAAPPSLSVTPAPEPEPEPEPEPATTSIYETAAVPAETSGGSFDFMQQSAPAEPAAVGCLAFDFAASADAAVVDAGPHSATSAASAASEVSATSATGASETSASSFDFITSAAQPAAAPEPPQATSIYNTAAEHAAETSGGCFDFMQPSAPVEPAAVGALAFDFAASAEPAVPDAGPQSATSAVSAASETSATSATGASETSASSFDFITSSAQPAAAPEPAPAAAGFDLSFMSQAPPQPALSVTPASASEPAPQATSIYGSTTAEPASSGFDFMQQPVAAPDASSTSMASPQSAVSGSSFDFITSSAAAPTAEPAAAASPPSSSGSIYDTSAASAAPDMPSSIYADPMASPQSAVSGSSFDFISSSAAPAAAEPVAPAPAPVAGSIYDTMAAGGSVTGEPTAAAGGATIFGAVSAAAPAGGGFNFVPDAGVSAIAPEPAIADGGFDLSFMSRALPVSLPVKTTSDQSEASAMSVASSAPSASSFDFINSSASPPPAPAPAAPPPAASIYAAAPAPAAVFGAPAAPVFGAPAPAPAAVFGGLELVAEPAAQSTPPRAAAGFDFISAGSGSLTPGGTVQSARVVPTAKPSSIYDAPAPAAAPVAAAAGGFTFVPDAAVPDLNLRPVAQQPAQTYQVTVQRAAGGLGMVINSTKKNDPIVGEVQPGGAAQVAGVAAGSVVLACMNVATSGRGQQGLIGLVKQQPPTRPIVLLLAPPQPNWQANVAPAAAPAAATFGAPAAVPAAVVPAAVAGGGGFDFIGGAELTPGGTVMAAQAVPASIYTSPPSAGGGIYGAPTQAAVTAGVFNTRMSNAAPAPAPAPGPAAGGGFSFQPGSWG